MPVDGGFHRLALLLVLSGDNILGWSRNVVGKMKKDWLKPIEYVLNRSYGYGSIYLANPKLGKFPFSNMFTVPVF